MWLHCGVGDGIFATGDWLAWLVGFGEDKEAIRHLCRPQVLEDRLLSPLASPNTLREGSMMYVSPGFMNRWDICSLPKSSKVGTSTLSSVLSGLATPLSG